jgi:hypothetical protein
MGDVGGGEKLSMVTFPCFVTISYVEATLLPPSFAKSYDKSIHVEVVLIQALSAV